jgi:hypothetical protein
MKTFYPTYLYIKTHRQTGLKYFGKTTQNPEQYFGSGKHWSAHLKKHGRDVSTEVLGFYIDKDACQAAAHKFSIDNNIVESVEWANLIAENGLDGGNTGRTLYHPHTDDTKKKISLAKLGQAAWNKGLLGVTPGNKVPRSDELKQRLSELNTGKVRPVSASLKTAEKLRGRKRPYISERLRGIRRSDETKKKMSLAQQNKTPMTEDTKNKIRAARKNQVFTSATREKLSGKVVAINKVGDIEKIPVELFRVSDDWVFHNSIEGKKRKAMKEING